MPVNLFRRAVNTYIPPDGKHGLQYFRSNRADRRGCPNCGGHACGSCSTRLRDMPVYADTRQGLLISCYRYRCTGCSRTFRDESHPGIQDNWKSVAMDMNASYNILVRQYLPDTRTVYDHSRYSQGILKDSTPGLRL